MPAVDVAVVCATQITGVSLRNPFCVYVRLQGQAIRTNFVNADCAGEVRYSERFCFQYKYDSNRSGRNRLFAELWTKSFFSQSCVSVAWIEMSEQHFVRGEQLRVNLRGTFEGKSATLSLVITPLDFGETAAVVQQVVPVAYGLPVEGVPLAPADPYTSAAYMPNVCAVVPDPASCRKCDAAPLPPPPPAFVGASLPPPLYPSFSQDKQQQTSSAGAGGQNAELDNRAGYPKQP
ncbi:hypothetical protein LSCM1_06490 [Leishmania martiniquensis]|uniref:C2 domain-containing protein n=1 Tax=Leishmania martiniquensis TaxID=1580590 RepID=A0A836KRH8_9TRYP|nr:hypothetical protein LSCM1_06490 [Leishmania martiniquensis]